jgi:glutamyl/glutaminyl-tRNA synthetase
MWQEMVNGTALGVKTCLRAKMDPKNVNGALRDPVIYRCKPEPHVQFVCSITAVSCVMFFVEQAPSSRCIRHTTLPAPLLTALKA